MNLLGSEKSGVLEFLLFEVWFGVIGIKDEKYKARRTVSSETTYQLNHEPAEDTVAPCTFSSP